MTCETPVRACMGYEPERQRRALLLSSACGETAGVIGRLVGCLLELGFESQIINADEPLWQTKAIEAVQGRRPDLCIWLRPLKGDGDPVGEVLHEYAIPTVFPAPADGAALTLNDLSTAGCLKSLLASWFGLWATKKDITSVTCIYAPDTIIEKTTTECLKAIARELPESRKIAAIDLASDEFVRQIEGLGFEILTLADGVPPRMSRLMGEAVSMTQTRYLMTIESDVVLVEDAAEQMLSHMRAFSPRLCAIESVYIKPDKTPAFPFSDSKNVKPAPLPNLRYNEKYVTLSCSLRTTASLVGIDWRVMPPFGCLDEKIGEHNARDGLFFGVAMNVKNVHYAHQSFEARNRIGLGVHRKKNVIVTAIYGRKSVLRDPLVMDPDFDYVCFTDDWSISSDVWEVRNIFSRSRNPNIAAKEYKVLTHRHFPAAETIIWMDASMEQVKPLLPLVRQHLQNDYDIGFFKHYCNRTTIEEEVAESVRVDVESISRMRPLLEHIHSKGYKNQNPLVHCGLYVKKNTPEVIRLMEAWWKYITQWSHQDQISLPFVAWQMNVPYALIEDTCYTDWVRHHPHAVPTRGQYKNWKGSRNAIA